MQVPQVLRVLRKGEGRKMFTKSRLITIGLSVAASAVAIGYLIKSAREEADKTKRDAKIAVKLGLV